MTALCSVPTDDSVFSMTVLLLMAGVFINIYIAEKKDTSGFSRPKELKSERSNKFNNGPLCFTPDGKTVYFTSEVETGKIAENRNYVNHSGIFIADFTGTDLVSVRPFKYNNTQYDVGQPSISKDGKYLFLLRICLEEAVDLIFTSVKWLMVNGRHL